MTSAEPIDRVDREPLAGARSMSATAFCVLVALFAAIVAVTWERWGDVRVDCGGALYQSAALAQGSVLYRDVLCPYGPIGPYAVAAMFSLFGVHLTVAYATGLVLLIGESCLLWFVGRRFLSEPESVVALAAFWVLQAFQPGLFDWVLPNSFASPFGTFFATATVALVVADGERPRIHLLAAASLCAALAGLSKVEHGAAAVVTLVAYCVLVRPRLPGGATVTRNLALATLPGALLTATVAGIFVTYVPWRELLFDNVYRYRSWSGPTTNLNAWLFPPLRALYEPAVFHYLVELPLRVGIVELGLRLLESSGWRRYPGGVLVLLALAFPLSPGYRPNPDLVTGVWSQMQFGWTPPVWAGVALWRLVAPRRAFDPLPLVAIFSVAETARWTFRVAWCPYYAPFGAYLAILVVRFVAGLLVRPRSPWPVVLVMSTWVAVSANDQWQVYSYKTGQLRYPRGTITTHLGEALQMQGVVDLLRNNTRPGDYVAVMPEEQLINFFAETRQPTRDIGIGPGWLATNDDVTRFLQELDAKAPRFVVVSTRRYPESHAGVVQRRHPRIAQYLSTHYDPRATFEMFTVMERRTSAAPPTANGRHPPQSHQIDASP